MSAVTGYLKEEYDNTKWIFLKKWNTSHIKETIDVCNALQQKIINKIDTNMSTDYKKLLEKLNEGGRVMEWRFTKSEDFMKYVYSRLHSDLLIDLYKISYLMSRIYALKHEMILRDGFQLLDYENGGIVIQTNIKKNAPRTIFGWLRDAIAMELQNPRLKNNMNKRRGKDKRRGPIDSDSDDTDDSDG